MIFIILLEKQLLENYSERVLVIVWRYQKTIVVLKPVRARS
ncbi:hypothetical protein [Flavobacterium azizsancarii]|nr:hypothetical protein [Flavobacterium azizsancarii]